MAKTTTQTVEASAEAEYVKIKALVVKSVAKGFRRIGLAFTREATHLDPELLTEDQVKALVADPNLNVTPDVVTVTKADAESPNPVLTPVASAVADFVDAK